MKYDPFSGALMRTGAPIATEQTRYDGKTRRTTSIIARLITPPDQPYPPRLQRQYGDDSSPLASLFASHVTPNWPDLYTLAGIGLLPFDVATGDQYMPQPSADLVEWWNDRPIDPVTGHVHRLRQGTTTIKAPMTSTNGKGTAVTLYRAQLVAAAALGLHPCTPVIAWYLQRPDVYGYGIDNIYTPTKAGVFRFEPLADPPEPHETLTPYHGTRQRRPRFVFTPWTHADNWPWPAQPSDTNAFLF